MNIFYLSNDTKTCAMYHVNMHCVKMILETAQLLSTAHRVLDGKDSIILSKSNRKQRVWILNDSDMNDTLYKATHINHPSAIWIRQSDANYKWLHNLLKDLCEEYTHRYGKIHKVQRTNLLDNLLNLPKSISIGKFTEPTPAMPEKYIISNDSIQSYRNYYKFEKRHLFGWRKRSIPDFIL